MSVHQIAHRRERCSLPSRVDRASKYRSPAAWLSRRAGERGPHALRARAGPSDARTAEGQGLSEGDESLDRWIGLDIRSTSNPLLRTSASGPFSAVSTFQIARLGSLFSIFRDMRYTVAPIPLFLCILLHRFNLSNVAFFAKRCDDF